MQINREQAQALVNSIKTENFAHLSEAENKVLNAALDILLVKDGSIKYTYVDVKPFDLAQLKSKLSRNPQKSYVKIFKDFILGIQSDPIVNKLIQLHNRASPSQLTQLRKEIQIAKDRIKFSNDIRIPELVREGKALLEIKEYKNTYGTNEENNDKWVIFANRHQLNHNPKEGSRVALMKYFFTHPDSRTEHGLLDLNNQINKVKEEIDGTKRQIDVLKHTISDYKVLVQKLEGSSVEDVGKKTELKRKEGIPAKIIAKENEIGQINSKIDNLQNDNTELDKEIVKISTFLNNIDYDKNGKPINNIDSAKFYKLFPPKENSSHADLLIAKHFFYRNTSTYNLLTEISNIERHIEKNNQQIESLKNKISALKKEISKLDPKSAMRESIPGLKDFYETQQKSLVKEYATEIDQLKKAKATASLSTREKQVLDKFKKEIDKPNVRVEGLLYSNLYKGLKVDSNQYKFEFSLFKHVFQQPNPRQALEKEIKEKERLISVSKREIPALEKFLREKGVDTTKIT